MSRQKAAKLMAMSDVDMAVYRSKRNQRCYWQRLSHEEWIQFCNLMADWFSNLAPDEWDEYIKANNARKAASDEKALAKKKASNV